MKVLSLFSGVGGFDLGLERAGMSTVFQCEWDKHATSVLQRHWPDVPRWGDISTLTGSHVLTHAPVVDVVAWGSPCQDLSVAGKRVGLEGSRSGLFHEGIRIINEIRKATNNVYPRISIWENVYGALSSNRGADFGVILNEMAEAGALVQEWRVLDAQYFGVPQRRRRVFLISVFDSATAARCPDPLLPVSQSVRRDTPTSGTPRQEPTGTTPEGVASRGEHPILIDRGAFNQGQNALYKPIISDDPVIPSLLARGPHAVAYDEYNHKLGGDVHHALRAGTKQSTGVVVDDSIVFENSYRDAARVATDGVSSTLSAKMGTGGNNTPMVAFGIQGNVIGRQDHNGPAGKGHNENKVVVELPVAYSIREDAKANTFSATELDRSNALNALRPSPQSHHAQMFISEPTMAVRRLTPIECERLMGWPDDWTAFKADGTAQADSNRYKQCGNGVASPVAEWVGLQVLNLRQHSADVATNNQPKEKQ